MNGVPGDKKVFGLDSKLALVFVKWIAFKGTMMDHGWNLLAHCWLLVGLMVYKDPHHLLHGCR